MEEAILKHLFELYDLKSSPKGIMPMTISWLGNSSVATLLTLYDLMYKGKFINQTLKKGSNIIFASVGAGVNMNAVAYKIPDSWESLLNADNSLSMIKGALVFLLSLILFFVAVFIILWIAITISKIFISG